MKKTLLKSMLLAVAMTAGVNAWAQLADGNYYIKNVASGQFLTGANSWGTQASVGNAGAVFTVTALEDGGYSLLHTGVTDAKKYLGDNLYTDSETPAGGWTVEQTTDGNYTISLTGKGYVAQGTEKGSTNDFVAVWAEEAGENAQWQFLTEEEAVAALSAATEENPLTATFLLKNPGFNRNISTAGWTMEASNKNLSGGADHNRCAESWQSAFTLSQSISVPNGKYVVTAQAALTDYTEAYDGADYPVVYANDETSPFNSMEEGDRGTNMATLSASFTNGKYYVEPVTVTVLNGTLTVGVKGTRTNTWCIWDNFDVTYYGPIQDLTVFVQAYEEAVAEAQALLRKAMYVEVREALNAAVEAEVNQNSKESLETAIANLTEAIANAKASIAVYEKLLAVLDDANGFIEVANENGAGVSDDLLGDYYYDYEEGAIADADIDATIEKVNAIVIATAKAQTADGSDMTRAIVNPSFETGNTTGWTFEASNDSGAKDNSNGTYTMSNADGKYIFNIWSSGNAISQTIEGLPNGNYKLTAVIATDAGQQVQLNANDESAVIDASAEGKGVGVEGAVEFKVFNGVATIGAEGVNKYWYKVDNFRLTLVQTLDVEEILAARTAVIEELADKAAALAQSGETMSEGAKDELEGAETVIESLLDDEDGEMLLDDDIYSYSVDFIKESLAYVETSIESYKTLAAGTIADNSLAHWTCTNTNTFHINTWSVEGNEGNDPSGMVTPFIENWVGKPGHLGEGTISYELKGINGGKYTASALVRIYSESGEEPAGATFFVNDSEKALTAENGFEAFEYNGMKGIYGTVQLVGEVDAAEEVLTIGIKIEDPTFNWVAIKSVTVAEGDKGEGVVTGITEVATAAQTAAKGIFNLSGQQVKSTQKGLYIINGKKVVK